MLLRAGGTGPADQATAGPMFVGLTYFFIFVRNQKLATYIIIRFISYDYIMNMGKEEQKLPLFSLFLIQLEKRTRQLTVNSSQK